jgi:hypothetical protein
VEKMTTKYFEDAMIKIGTKYKQYWYFYKDHTRYLKIDLKTNNCIIDKTYKTTIAMNYKKRWKNGKHKIYSKCF